MAQFEAFETGVEANGQTVLAFVEGAGEVSSVFEDRALSILADEGIEDPQPGDWYSQQAWLDGLSNIAESIGDQTLTNIGKKIPENADWPPGVNSVAGGLESIDEAYHMNHRGGKIGHYTFESTGPTSGVVSCENPYPCAFDRGIVEAVADEFSPSTAFVDVQETSERCRSEGGQTCVYEVSW